MHYSQLVFFLAENVMALAAVALVQLYLGIKGEILALVPIHWSWIQ